MQKDIKQENNSLKQRLKRQIADNKLLIRHNKDIQKRYQDLINKTRQKGYGLN